MPLKFRRRIVVFLFLIISALFFLAGRIGWIQFVEGQRLSVRVKEQLKDSQVIHLPRGTIYDRNGKELAVSNMTKSLYANPRLIENADALAGQLAPILDMEQTTIKKILTQEAHFVWVFRMLEPEQSEEITALIKQNKIRGLNFIEESKRYYPNKIMLSQVLGFVGIDDTGLEGIEASLDKTLKGRSEEQVIDTDNRGLPILESIFSYVPQKERLSVYLTIDSYIQYIVEKALDSAMEKTKSKAAIGIVMNPKTGEILAMANRPAYDPNFFNRYPMETWKNNAVSLVYEPGSTFKAIIAAAALEEGRVAPETKFYDAGHIEISGQRIKNSSGKSYGNISFLEVMENSINTSFIEVGLNLGAKKLIDYAKKFGFGTSTGLEISGEEEGILFDADDMRNIDIATMSIGQGIAVTPMQMLTAFSAIANGGVLPKPYIIKEYRTVDGREAESNGKSAGRIPAQSSRQVIKPETAKILTDIMEKVVSEGSAVKAAVPGYKFAGKTGTAEKIKESGHGYLSGRYIASFAGFGPVEDPEFAVIVILDDPTYGEYYGGQIAAPVFSEIMSQIMRYGNIYPQEGQDLQTLFPRKKEPDKQPDKDADNSRQIILPEYGKTQVPNLYGQSIRVAGETLKKQQLKFVPRGTGVAVRQSIAPYEKVDAQTEIVVYFEPKP